MPKPRYKPIKVHKVIPGMVIYNDFHKTDVYIHRVKRLGSTILLDTDLLMMRRKSNKTV